MCPMLMCLQPINLSPEQIHIPAIETALNSQSFHCECENCSLATGNHLLN